MLEKIATLPEGIDGVRAIGKISKEDYDRVLGPVIENARRDGRRIRFLYHFGPEFEGFTPGAAWEDARMGFRSLHLFEGCAVVTDVAWVRDTSRLIAFLMPCPVRVLGNVHYAEAVDWLQSLPRGAGVSHQLIPEAGVIVAEVREPLRAQDFDALSLTADAWLETHDELRGIVIHARTFPGWENIGGFLRHVRFVRDHHRKVRRIALAADTRLAEIAPRLAEHFVQAEIKRFAYDDLEQAIAWASAHDG